MGHADHPAGELDLHRLGADDPPGYPRAAVKCFNCGAEVAPPARFCASCGTPVSDPQESTVVLPPEADDQLLRRVRMSLSGEYEVVEELARGGMGIVFRATEVGLQRQVALKVLSPDLGLTGRAVARFKREARTVAELEHPNIVPVYRVGQVGGVLHIAMKFVEGRSLDAIIAAQGPLPVPVVIYVLRGVTRAMAYAHERDIVHRDIKAANILIDRDGRVLVTDFGVALRAADVELTVDGTVIGTPAYMSPEQCAGRRAEPQSDQYSLGIVAFHMLTGAVPFHSETLAGLMQHHFFTAVPDLRLVRDDVPDALLEVLNRALAKSPGERFGTTHDMSIAIEAIPFSEGDRLASEQSLQALARGETIGPVAARPMPPLHEAPTSPIPVPRHAKRRGARGRTVRIATAAGLLLGLAWWVSRPRPAAQLAANVARPADSTPHGGTRGDSSGRTLLVRPVAPAVTGKLRLLTSPTDAEILIDGRRIGTGSVVDKAVAAGARRLSVRAAGYQTFDTLIVVPADSTVSLGRITLRGRGAGA